MKKNSAFFLFVSSLFALMLFGSVHAQSWSLTGNSNATALSKLGTTNSVPLRFFTNNNVRAYISTSGNFGIGTTSPQQRLHVEGTGNQAIFVSTTGLGSASGSGFIGSAKDLPTAAGQRLGYFLTGSRGGAENGYNAAGIVGYAAGAWTAGSSRPAYLTFETTPLGSTSRQERVRITEDGSVGIGIASPSNALHVIGRGRFSDGLSVESGGIFSTYSGGNGVEGYGSSAFGIGVLGEGFYGIYGTADNGGYGGYFNGNVFTTGSYSGSDRKLKQNITDLTSAMDIINKLQPKAYEFRRDGNFKFMNLPEGKHYGLIAQDLEQVLPTLVKDTKFNPQIGRSRDEKSNQPAQKAEVIDFKAVNYTELIPLVIKAVQEQNAENQTLKTEVQQLRSELESLKQQLGKFATGQANTPARIGSLSQATPNPAKAHANISYRLPEGSGKAQLQLTDNLGRTVQTVRLTQSGTVNVDVSALGAGIYNYSLVVDGKTVETKRLTVGK